MTNRYPHPKSLSASERDFYPPSPWEKGPGVEVRKAVLESLLNKGKRGWVMTNRYPHPKSLSTSERDFYPPSPWEKGPGVEVRKAVLESLLNKETTYKK
jgi:hypothetical protein